MKYLCFKVVKPRHIGTTFTSSNMRWPNELEYRVGVTTYSHTPIFVFLDEKRAIKFTGLPENNLVVLQGYSTVEPFPIAAYTEYILDPILIQSRHAIEHFWTNVIHKGYKPGNRFNTQRLPRETYGVYDFTPEKIIPLKHALGD